MRYLSLAILLGSAAAAQTQNWQPKGLQYFNQFHFPEAFKQPAMKTDPAPVKRCAIPLLSVLKKNVNIDHMPVVPAPQVGAKIVVVTPPAPSCDDVR